MSVRFDIAAVPFSRRGSWLNVSPIIGTHERSEHLHLVSHRTGLNAVLRLRVDDVTEVVATPASLTWRTPHGTVEAAFEATDRLRLRGRGAILVIEDGRPDLPFHGSFQYRDPADGAVVFSSHETGHRYRIALLSGARERTVDTDGRASWTFTGAEWEVAIDEFGTTPRPLTAAGFDAVTAETASAFAVYRDAVAPWRSERTPAAEAAAYVLWSATVDAYGAVQRESVLMSKHWMDRVWSWDHCFNALALAPGLPDQALDQYLMPFDHQEAEGALPDMVGPTGSSRSFVKPPVHGWTLGRLLRDLPGLDRDTRAALLEKLAALTAFWLERRRTPGRPVPYYLHGNDSGWDNSTAFLAGEPVESPDLAALLVVQLGVQAALADELGDDRAGRWRSERDTLVAAIASEFMVDGRLVARAVSDGGTLGATSLLRLVAIVACDDLPQSVVAAIVAELPSYLTEWGLATERPDSELYADDGYWRGPIWAPTTLLIEDGLRRAGATALANSVSSRFRRLCERNGFAENFDARTGSGLRDLAYTWTASCYLLLAREHEERMSAAPEGTR